MGTLAALDRTTPLPVDRGANVVLHGIVRTSVDGSAFDALLQWDGLAPGTPRPDGLFDLAAGGLTIVEQHRERHEYVIASTGTPGPACVAAGLPSPCLAPRLAELGHQRLRTGGEFARTLSGAIEMEVAPAPFVSLATVREAQDVALLVGLVAFVAALAHAARRLARSPMGRVRAASREAMRATRGDATLERVRAQVRALLARASQLDVARRSCARKLRSIDGAALARRTEACARSPSPDAAEAVEWLTAERAEATRLEGDLASSIAGIERIESALRVVALRVRAHRGVRARAGRADPVNAVATELELREQGLAEADALLGP
jgi:hypothetical protein